MSDLGDALEAMHTSAHRWTTLRLYGHEWRHEPTLLRAFHHHFDELRRQQPGSVQSMFAFKTTAGGEPPEETRQEWRMWLAKPDRRRVEYQIGDEVVTAVFRREWWWSWSRTQGLITNEGAANHEHGSGPAEGLIDPARHLSALDVQPEGRGIFLSRPAFLVTAAPRPSKRGSFDETHHMLGTGADEYRLVVDGETGIFLRAEARFQGNAFRIVEVEQIAVDETFGESTFDPAALGG